MSSRMVWPQDISPDKKIQDHPDNFIGADYHQASFACNCFTLFQ